LDEVLDYYKALVEEELPHVLEDIRHQLEVEEDEPSERFADINRSINKFLDYVEVTYIGKVIMSKSGLKMFLNPGIRTTI
jgi:hypothetical protein